MPLHIDYRPRTWDEFYGNKKTIAKLRSKFDEGKDIPHVFLLFGPPGTGKTTIGRIIKTVLKCADSDFVEINSSSNRGIDTSREIMGSMRYLPLHGPVRLYLLDEAHNISKDGQNALLKALEDTPDHVYFILCTTDPDKLIPALRTRCSEFEVQRLPDKEISMLLEDVLEAEKADISKDALLAITEAAEGCPRKALVLLDQVIDLPKEEMADAVQSAQVGEQKEAIDLCRALFAMTKGGKKTQWTKFAVLLKGLKEDPEKIRRAVLGYCNSIVMKEDNAGAIMIMEAFRQNLYDLGRPGLTMACYNAMVDLTS